MRSWAASWTSTSWTIFGAEEVMGHFASLAVDESRLTGKPEPLRAPIARVFKVTPPPSLLDEALAAGLPHFRIAWRALPRRRRAAARAVKELFSTYMGTRAKAQAVEQ
jgi:hypothetical protein